MIQKILSILKEKYIQKYIQKKQKAGVNEKLIALDLSRGLALNKNIQNTKMVNDIEIDVATTNFIEKF